MAIHKAKGFYSVLLFIAGWLRASGATEGISAFASRPLLRVQGGFFFIRAGAAAQFTSAQTPD
jgi:hypothetical protein